MCGRHASATPSRGISGAVFPGCGFCAICLQDCGKDAHEHIRQRHGGVTMFDRTAFERARRKRFSALVVNAIQGLAADGSALQRAVVAALAKVSRNLGLHLPCWSVTCCDHARSAQADLRDLDIDPKEVLVAAGVADELQAEVVRTESMQRAEELGVDQATARLLIDENNLWHDQAVARRMIDDDNQWPNHQAQVPPPEPPAEPARTESMQLADELGVDRAAARMIIDDNNQWKEQAREAEQRRLQVGSVSSEIQDQAHPLAAPFTHSLTHSLTHPPTHFPCIGRTAG